MSNVSSALNPYASASSSDLASMLANKKGAKKEDENKEFDSVTLSDEALELLDELRYKENLTKITNENQLIFDKVSKKLPATEGFMDMLNWISAQSGEEESFFSVDGEIDRNVYEKDPEKYAELWSNMYNHFGSLMETLGLDQDETMMREVLANEKVQVELIDRFKESFDDDTNSLLTYFNITV